MTETHTGSNAYPNTDPNTTRDHIHTVRIELPSSLCRLAGVPHELELRIVGPVTQASILDALETLCPSLQGTIRDHATGARRPFIRFFACEEDISHHSPDALLPEPIQTGAQPFLIIGAIAGG